MSVDGVAYAVRGALASRAPRGERRRVREGRDDDERHAAVALNAVPGLGPVRQRALLAEHGSSARALAALPRAVAGAAR